jgi:hypothetical protein
VGKEENNINKEIIIWSEVPRDDVRVACEVMCGVSDGGSRSKKKGIYVVMCIHVVRV